MTRKSMWGRVSFVAGLCGLLGMLAGPSPAMAQSDEDDASDEADSSFDDAEATDDALDPAFDEAPQEIADRDLEDPVPYFPVSSLERPADVEVAAGLQRRRADPKVLFPGLNGVALQAGGGVTNQLGNGADVADMGGYWDVRLAVGLRRFVGFEAAYVGQLQSLNADVMGTEGLLLRGGAEANLRLNLAGRDGRLLTIPFVTAGAGWQHLSLRDVDSPGPGLPVAAGDDLLAVPVGAGFTLGYGGLVVDARFTYRPTFGENAGRTDADSWTAGAQAGWEF
jgi:hypothetical protein